MHAESDAVRWPQRLTCPTAELASHAVSGQSPAFSLPGIIPGHCRRFLAPGDNRHEPQSGQTGIRCRPVAVVATLAPSDRQGRHARKPRGPQAPRQGVHVHGARHTEGRLGGQVPDRPGVSEGRQGRVASQDRRGRHRLQSRDPAAKPRQINTDIYSTGIAIIFLCSLNPSKYSTEISSSAIRSSAAEVAWRLGLSRQADGRHVDDAVRRAGLLGNVERSAFQPQLESTERVANWLLRTQDPDGNWGYQGKEAEGRIGFELVKQDSARPGMAAAGLGCTYMVADLLGLAKSIAEQDAEPAALGPRSAKGSRSRRRPQGRCPPRAQAQDRGRDGCSKNYKIDPPGFTHYYLYALERYQSFLEAAEGNSSRSRAGTTTATLPAKKQQQDDGSWKGHRRPRRGQHGV